MPRAVFLAFERPVGSPRASLVPAAIARDCSMSLSPGGTVIRGQRGNSMVDILSSLATVCGAALTSSLSCPVVMQIGHGSSMGSDGSFTSVAMVLVCTGLSRAGWFRNG